MDIKEQKKAIRVAMSKAKKEITNDAKIILSQQIFDHVEQLIEFQKANTILLYYALSDEVQTEIFIKKWYKKKRIVLPVVDGENLVLKEYIPEHIAAGYCNIIEPQQFESIDTSQIEFAVIPGVAFDCDKNRLGRGRGFYDRFLIEICTPVIGVCFEVQIVEQIPLEPFDKPMSAVITENGAK